MEPKINEEIQLVSIVGKIWEKESDLPKYRVSVKVKRRKE